jgi:hypothetical protein
MKKQESKKKLKKYQTKKFDYYKTLNEYYIENGDAYISIKVYTIDDIISKYSVKNDEVLNYEFMRYLETNASYIPDKYSLVLEICNHHFNEEEQEIIKKVIRNHYSISLINKKEELKSYKRKGYYLLLTGLVSLFIYAILAYTGKLLILSEIFSLIFCFAMWEATDITIFDNDDIKEEIVELQNLSEIQVIFKD